MSVPLAHKRIEIRQGFKEDIRKSSTIDHKADVVGLFAYKLRPGSYNPAIHVAYLIV